MSCTSLKIQEQSLTGPGTILKMHYIMDFLAYISSAQFYFVFVFEFHDIEIPTVSLFTVYCLHLLRIMEM